MAPERMAGIGVLVLLLLAGLLISQRAMTPPQDDHVAVFRQWFWEHRSLDLAVQVGLIFVGALGIAALLPRGREEGEDSEDGEE